MKLCLERTAFTICGTTVSSNPITPGKMLWPSRNRCIRLSRSSSFTRRSRRRDSENSLFRSSPRVVGRAREEGEEDIWKKKPPVCSRLYLCANIRAEARSARLTSIPARTKKACHGSYGQGCCDHRRFHGHWGSHSEGIHRSWSECRLLFPRSPTHRSRSPARGWARAFHCGCVRRHQAGRYRKPLGASTIAISTRGCLGQQCRL